MSIKKIKKLKAFTLIELIIYLTIVSIIVNTFVLFAWNIISRGEKNDRQEEVSSAAMLLSSKIKYEIRNAQDINVSSSDFGVNLANNPNKKITLEENETSNPIVFDVVNGEVRIARGTGDPVSIISNGVKIDNLTFTNSSSVDGLTKNLNFTLSVISRSPSVGNVFESVNLESSAELRGN